MTAVMVGVAALVGTTANPWRVVLLTGLTAIAVHVPALVLPGAVAAMGAIVVRKIRGLNQRGRAAQEDLAALSDLTALGLSGGLGLQTALTVAGQSLGGAVADEVGALLRQARVTGLAAALTAATGIGKDLYRVVGRAAASGSALLDPVARLAAETHAEMAAERLRAVRRLPVSMLFPLTLLILPGFLLLTVAPALLDAFGRLEM